MASEANSQGAEERFLVASKPEGDDNVEDGPPSRITPLRRTGGGSIHERRGGAMMRREIYSLARMSGMLGLSMGGEGEALLAVVVSGAVVFLV